MPFSRIARALVLVPVALAVSGMVMFSSPSEEKRISIYSVVANYSLPVAGRNGQDYVGIVEVLDPLGTVKATADGKRWRLLYNDTDSEFTVDSSRVLIRRHEFDLHAKFLLENGRGLVPVASLGQLLSDILGGPVTFHEASRRVFIGSVGVHFTAQISSRNPPKLTMNFSSPVNPMIATEPGKLHMLFSREPVVAPGSPALTFSDQAIPSASYAEDNGAAEITVNGTAPLFASFSNGNRTITISASPTPKEPVAQAPGQPAVSPIPPAQTATVPGSAPAAPFFAVVDASHGGADRGEAISDQLAEKDITLALARSLRQQLQARGLKTLLLRDGDTTLGLDERASEANVTHAAVYICLHASSEGHGVRLYTALLPAHGQDRGLFLDWSTAQDSFLPLSKAVSAGLASELQKKQISARMLIAPLRPLNSIATAAVGVEVAPPAEGIAGLNSAAYQQLVSGSLADGILALRARLGAGR